MHKIVRVELGHRGYDVAIGAGLLEHAKSALDNVIQSRRTFVITDENVATHHLSTVVQQFSESDPIILPPGESSKSWAGLSALCDTLLMRGVERNDILIALGGGVVGDLVGFAASILKRGCSFIQIPTTLLSQVDSSVGGKTAINVSAGKNLVGAFHQPIAVLIDPMVLRTLDPRQLRSGYAEVVKYGLINDADFFAWCEANASKLLAGNLQAQTYAIKHSIEAKSKIVQADERETLNQRALLNLGHTFGHALEAETEFSDVLTHGEAVATGMCLAHAYSAKIGKCPTNDANRLANHIASVGLAASLEKAGVSASGEKLVSHMMHDKKMTGGNLPFILTEGIGRAYVESQVKLADIAQFLDNLR